MGIKSPRHHLDHNFGQVNIFECLFIVRKGDALASIWYPLLLSSSFHSLKEIKCQVF